MSPSCQLSPYHPTPSQKWPHKCGKNLVPTHSWPSLVWEVWRTPQLEGAAQRRASRGTGPATSSALDPVGYLPRY